MRFGSCCSGIEAASVAWHPLGWTAAWLAEIEPFPSAVLAHHYPEVPNHGDMTALPKRMLLELRVREFSAADVVALAAVMEARDRAIRLNFTSTQK